MSRHLVRSFLLTTAFSSVVTAGPCRPRPVSASSRIESVTQSASSSVVLIDTDTVSYSDTVSQDATTGTGASINPTDASLTFSNIDPISTAITEVIDFSTDWYPYLPISSATDEDGTSSTAAPVSFATDTSSSIGSESIISHATDTALSTASETESFLAIPTDMTATTGGTAIETQPTLSATQSISADTTPTSGEADASSTISSAIGTETTTSVAIDTTVGTSGIDSSLVASSDTTTTSGEASSATISATPMDITETPQAAETTSTSGDVSTTGTNSPTSTTEIVIVDNTIASSETTATSSQTDTIAITETGTSKATNEVTLTDTTATSKEMDTAAAASADTTIETGSFPSATDAVSTDTTATLDQTTATSGDSTAGTEASSTTEVTGSDATMTTKSTDITTATSSDLTTTTVTDSFTSTTQDTSTDTTVTSSETDTSTTTTSGDSATSTTETASKDTTVTTTGTDTSSTTTPGEPTSTVTDTITSVTEATSDTTLTSSDTGTLTTTTSGDLTTGTDTSATEASLTDTATTETTATTTETTASSSTTAEPEPTCTNNLKTPAPANKICGKTGYAGYTYTGQGATNSLQACAKSCKSNNQCTSFNFAADSVCFLYLGALEERNGLPTTWMLYELDCFCDLDKPDAEPEPEPTCKNNIIDPIPDYRACGATGWAGGLYLEGPGPEGSTKSLLACAKACTNGRCRAFKFEADQECTFYVGTGLTQPDGTATSYKWYQPECFCDLDKVDTTEPEPEPTCKNNVVNPVPEEMICGEKGDGTGVYYKGPGPSGSSKSPRACADACIASDDCTFFQFEVDKQCEFYVGRLSNLDGTQTSYKWYDKNCFCDLDKVDPTDPETPPEPETTCKNNIISPIHQNRVCGAMGYGDGLLPGGASPADASRSLWACANACKDIQANRCAAFRFEAGKECSFFVGGMSPRDGTATSFKWYERDCFCDLDKPEPTEPEPICVDNSPTEKVCGVQGRAGNQCMQKVFSSRLNSLDACREACKTNNCDSFNFRDDNDLCEAFQGRVGGTDGLSSPWKWYDTACFDSENTPTDPEPQCINNTLEPSPKDSACGAMGNPTGQGRQEIGSATATSVQGCRDACHKEADCDSFQLEEGFNCYLFKGKVGATDGRTTAEVWYDMSCFCDLEAQPNNPDEEEVCVDEVHRTRVCGLEGRPMYECIQEVPEDAPDPAAIKSLEACRDHCKSLGCDSFAFKKDQTCLLWKGPIGGAEPRDEFPGVKLYDMSCFAERPTKDVCIGEPLNPLPAKTVCGKPGDVDTNTLSNKRLRTDVTLAECYKACKAAGDCDVFNFNNQRCELYKTKSPLSGASVAFTGSTIQWWQPSCFCDDAKTDPKDPEPVCVNNMLSPQPKNSNCGATGSIVTEDLSLDILGFGDETSLKACSDSCKAFDGCESFSFLEQNFCIFFAASAGPTDGSETAHAYYDMSCFCEGTKEEPKKEDPNPVREGELKSPLPQDTVCGENRKLRTGAVSGVGVGNPGSLVDCNRQCKSQPGCDTIAWIENRSCVFYRNKISLSDLTDDASSSQWWSRSCFN